MKMPSIPTTGKYEYEYVIADILPSIMVLMIGIAFLIVIACSYCWKCYQCDAIGNTLINWTYGGSLLPSSVSLKNERRREIALHIENIRVDEKKLKILMCMLATNAVSLFIFAATIFSSVFFINSNFIESNFANGCPTDRDCFVSDNNYVETPIGNNCSVYRNTNSTDRIICYGFNLSLLSSIGNAGGTLLVATLAIGFITKILICCQNWYHFKQSTYMPKITEYCRVVTCKILVLFVLLLIIISIIVVIHLSVLHNITQFTLLKLIIQYVSVLFCLIITFLTPWRTMIHNQPLGPIYLRQERNSYGNRVVMSNRRTFGPIYLKPTGEGSTPIGCKRNGDNTFPVYHLFCFQSISAIPLDLVCLTRFFYKGKEMPQSQLNLLESNKHWPQDRDVYSMQFRGDRLPKIFLIKDTLTWEIKGPFYSENLNVLFKPDYYEQSVRIEYDRLPTIFLTLERVGGEANQEENQQAIGPVILFPVSIKNNSTVYVFDFTRIEFPNHPIYLTNFFHNENQNTLPSEQNTTIETATYWNKGDHPLPCGARLYSVHLRDNLPQAKENGLQLRTTPKNEIQNVIPMKCAVPADKRLWIGPIPTNYFKPLEEVELTLEIINGQRASNQERSQHKFKMDLKLSTRTTDVIAYTFVDGTSCPPCPLYLTRFYHQNGEIPKNQEQKQADISQWPSNTHVYSMHFETNIPYSKFYLKSIDNPNARNYGPITPNVPDMNPWIGPIYFGDIRIPCEITLRREGSRIVDNSESIDAYLVPTERFNGKPAYRLHVHVHNELPHNPIYLTNFYYTEKQMSNDQRKKLKDDESWTNLKNVYSIKIPCENKKRFYFKNSEVAHAREYGPLTEDINHDIPWLGPLYINAKPLGPIYITLEREGYNRVRETAQQTIGSIYLILTENEEDGSRAYRLRYQGQTPWPLVKNDIHLTSFFYIDDKKPEILNNPQQEQKWAEINMRQLYSMHFGGELPKEHLKFNLRNADINDTTIQTITQITENTEPGAIPISIITE